MNASAVGLPGVLRGIWYEGQRVISRLSAAYSASKGGIHHRNLNAFNVVEGNSSSDFLELFQGKEWNDGGRCRERRRLVGGQLPQVREDDRSTGMGEHTRRNRTGRHVRYRRNAEKIYSN